jgi:hypothetical protein
MSASAHCRTPQRGKSTIKAPSSAANGAVISTPNQRRWKMSVIHRNRTRPKMAMAFFSPTERPHLGILLAHHVDAALESAGCLLGLGMGTGRAARGTTSTAWSRWRWARPRASSPCSRGFCPPMVWMRPTAIRFAELPVIDIDDSTEIPIEIEQHQVLAERVGGLLGRAVDRGDHEHQGQRHHAARRGRGNEGASTSCRRRKANRAHDAVAPNFTTSHSAMRLREARLDEHRAQDEGEQVEPDDLHPEHVHDRLGPRGAGDRAAGTSGPAT